MACITRLLVFIQDDRAIPIHLSGAVDPHVTLAPGIPSILIHKHRGLICLQHVAVI